jgi:hypothetical protein
MPPTPEEFELKSFSIPEFIMPAYSFNSPTNSGLHRKYYNKPPAERP